MQQSTNNDHLILPDLYPIVSTVLKKAINPNHGDAAPESRRWIHGYNIFPDRKKAFFAQGAHELLVARTYPYAPREAFRTICDFINLLFVVDEISDDQGGIDARATGNSFLTALIDPNWSDDSVLCTITHEFRGRLITGCGPKSYRRFLHHCSNYIDAVGREAELREAGITPTLREFVPLRRENSAIRTCFALFDYALGIDLPDNVFENPVFMEAYWAAADMVCWSNDLYSYRMERTKGLLGNNVVAVLMHESNIDLHTATKRVEHHFSTLMRTYTRARRRVAGFRWGGNKPLARDVNRWLDAMGCWVVGNIVWSFESPRYWGALQEEVRRTRVVRLDL